MSETTIWRHGTRFRIRRVETGGYSTMPDPRHPERVLRPPRLVTYRISVNGRLVDSALTLAAARRLCERHGRRTLVGEGRYV